MQRTTTALYPAKLACEDKISIDWALLFAAITHEKHFICFDIISFNFDHSNKDLIIRLIFDLLSLFKFSLFGISICKITLDLEITSSFNKIFAPFSKSSLEKPKCVP